MHAKEAMRQDAAVQERVILPALYRAELHSRDLSWIKNWINKKTLTKIVKHKYRGVVVDKLDPLVNFLN